MKERRVRAPVAQQASDQFMNQHLPVKMYPLGVASPGNNFAKAGPMSEASALAAAIGWALAATGALIRHIFPMLLNDSELIRDPLDHRIRHRVFALSDECLQGLVDGRVERRCLVFGEQFLETGIATLRMIETSFRMPLLEAVVVGNR